MERQRSSSEHIKKVQDYFNYIEREQEGLNEENLLEKALPDHIRANVLIHITQSMVTACNFFDECEAGFIRRVMTSMEQCFFGTQYMILDSSTPADGMYFVKKGVVELLTTESENEVYKVTKKLEADDSFAEECLLTHWEQNPFLARTATNCELWFLNRSTFNRLVEDFPHVREILAKFTNKACVAVRRASVHSVKKAAEMSVRNSTLFIHPDNLFIQVWFGVVLFFSVYYIIVLPFRVVFMENHNISSYLYGILKSQLARQGILQWIEKISIFVSCHTGKPCMSLRHFWNILGSLPIYI